MTPAPALPRSTGCWPGCRRGSRSDRSAIRTVSKPQPKAAGCTIVHPCRRWIGTVVARGSGRVDADILRDAHRAATAGDIEALTAANRRGLAYRATAELALETTAQGDGVPGDLPRRLARAVSRPLGRRSRCGVPSRRGRRRNGAGRDPARRRARRLSAGDGGQPRLRRPAPRLDWPDRAASASSAHSNRR